MTKKLLMEVTKRCSSAVGVLVGSALAGSISLGSTPTSTQPSDGPVRLLSIGNSYSVNATAHLPAMTAAAGKGWVYRTAHIAGASFARHIKAADAFEADAADPDGKPYKLTAHDGTVQLVSLKDLLTAQRWQYVTIQQSSADSARSETFQPSAHRLTQYVRRYAPQAKLLIHETWAYRDDHPAFKAGEFTQDDMFAALHRNYEDLATREGAVGVIPVGTAFQNLRQDPRWKPIVRTDWDLSRFAHPDLPPADHDLNVNYRWDMLVDPPRIVPDRGHSTILGEYLGSCVWYEFFFGDVRQTTYCPPTVSAADAELIRDIAHRTVREGLIPKVKTSQRRPKPTALDTAVTK